MYGRPFRYRFAELLVESDFAWREATPVDDVTACDLVVLDGERRGLPRPPETNASSRDGQRVRFIVPQVGRFVVEDGQRIVAWPTDTASAEALSQQLAGSALALALMQRETLVLHGAVVRMAGQAVVVVGHSGDGKSTLAAACLARGHEVVSDDLAILDLDGEAWTARAVAAIVRVSDDVAARLLPDREGWTAAGKAVRGVPHDAPARLPLAGLVCLDWGTPPACTRLAGVDAAMALLDRSFCRPAFRQPQAARALQACTAIATRYPVWHLRRPRDLTVLAQITTLLERAVLPRA